MNYTVLGIMTGTSCDGINGALIETDGVDYIKRLGFCEVPFSQDLANQLRQAGKDAHQNGIIDQQSPKIKTLETAYTQAIINFITDNFDINTLNLIGLHGQTILHRPDQQISVQLGNPSQLAQATQTNVVFNFRHNDLINGGQGAPLAPLYHEACLSDTTKPALFVNIGGVANVTFVGAEIMGFDIGIGNCISDDLCQKFFNKPYDPNGEIADSGTVHYHIAHQMAQMNIFLQKPPKSFDRNEFDITPLAALSPLDMLATINYMAAYCIIQADAFYPQKPKMRIIAGGGVHNQTTLGHLRTLSDIPVKTAQEIGLNSDAIEAECFAWLAVRSIKNLPLSVPSTTGVTHPVSGGDLYPYHQ